jgi:hypothetical protein
LSELSILLLSWQWDLVNYFLSVTLIGLHNLRRNQLPDCRLFGERERVCVCVFIYIYMMRAMCESYYLKLKLEPVFLFFFSIWRIKQSKNHDFLIRLLRVQLCKNSLSFSLELQKWAFDE